MYSFHTFPSEGYGSSSLKIQGTLEWTHKEIILVISGDTGHELLLQKILTNNFGFIWIKLEFNIVLIISWGKRRFVLSLTEAATEQEKHIDGSLQITNCRWEKQPSAKEFLQKSSAVSKDSAPPTCSQFTDFTRHCQDCHFLGWQFCTRACLEGGGGSSSSAFVLYPSKTPGAPSKTPM